jgi:3-dehydroquinate synthase
MVEFIDKINSVVFGETVFGELDKFFIDKKPTSVFILTDENVNTHCLSELVEKCKSLKNATVIEIPAGDKEKSFSTVAKIVSLLIENNADRNSLLVNLGGGMVSDIGGFTASVYKRGIRFINIPTTLLAMVDASLGGKTGVNFLGIKNVIGTFSEPEGIFIYPGFLKTLPAREMNSGYAEIVKHILLSDEAKLKNFELFPSEFVSPDKINEHITHSVTFKLKIISDDFKEADLRKILNFGHTIGHALESYSLEGSNSLLHGEAVALGMVAELFLSVKHAGFPENQLMPVVQFIRNIYSDLSYTFNTDELVQFLYADKKNIHDEIAFSLLRSPGNPAGIYFPGIESILESLVFMSEEFSKARV